MNIDQPRSLVYITIYFSSCILTVGFSFPLKTSPNEMGYIIYVWVCVYVCGPSFSCRPLYMHLSDDVNTMNKVEHGYTASHNVHRVRWIVREKKS